MLFYTQNFSCQNFQHITFLDNIFYIIQARPQQHLETWTKLLKVEFFKLFVCCLFYKIYIVYCTSIYCENKLMYNGTMGLYNYYRWYVNGVWYDAPGSIIFCNVIILLWYTWGVGLFEQTIDNILNVTFYVYST